MIARYFSRANRTTDSPLTEMEGLKSKSRKSGPRFANLEMPFQSHGAGRAGWESTSKQKVDEDRLPCFDACWVRGQKGKDHG